jgi:uncharacterized protein YbjT (DUF2867 family)
MLNPLIALAIVAPLLPGGTFVDDNESVHESSIGAIAAAGITSGCNPPANDRFCPTAPVTRGQMAAFLNRALSPASTPLGNFFDDGSPVRPDDIAGGGSLTFEACE